MPTREQAEIDASNAEFWEELCGTRLARAVGVADASPAALARYDTAYMDFYPYLERYLPPGGASGSVLEVGLGYGTVGQRLASSGLSYHGADIAAGPVAMMRHRLGHLGMEPEQAERRVRVASVLELPHADDEFDHVYSIGCLHHTGDIPRAVGEVRRVLRPGGRAVVMLYAKHSARQAWLAAWNLPSRLLRRGPSHEQRLRWRYDRSLAGEAAPVTEFTSVAEAKRIFGGFASVRVRRENMDEPVVWRLHIPRRWFLGRPAHLAGRDLYIAAVK